LSLRLIVSRRLACDSVDTSGSMRMGPKIAMPRQAYDSIPSQLGEGQDEVALFTSTGAARAARLYRRSRRLEGRLQVQPFGTTSVRRNGRRARRLQDAARSFVG
jgi:hypothetical protein